MSALGGVLMFGGGRVDPTRVAELGARLDRLGPDGGHDLVAGQVGMTYRAFHTNAESRREHQPYCRGHRAVLCWDGRLDNRDELLPLLREELRGEDTDAAIAMAAYLRWHRNGIAKLVGDFALAVWDRHDRAVWLARDCVGTRTLYYHVNQERAIWSTDLGALLDVSGASIEVNDEYVAGFLTRGPDPGLTPYVGLHAVKPAHAVRIDTYGMVSEQRFWGLDLGKEIRYRTDAEYEEQFRQLFRESVRARLRSDCPVLADLSGGLDSSSIVCMADEVLLSGDGSAPSLETISYVHDDAPTADERRFIAHVEARRGHGSHHVLDSEFPFLMLPPLDDAPYDAPNFNSLCSGFHRARCATAKAIGARTLMSGQGGDEMYRSRNNPLPLLADHVVQMRPRALHRGLRTWSKVLERSYVSLLWDATALHVLPTPIYARYTTRQHLKLPPWIDPAFARRTTLEQRIHTPATLDDVASPTASDQAMGFLVAAKTIASGARRAEQLDISYPHLDRRLVEFMQAIPFDQKLRPRESRSLQRRSLRSTLPAKILERRGKGEPRESVFRSFRRQKSALLALFDDSRAALFGYMVRSELLAAVTRASEGFATHSAPLLDAVAFELWLRRLHQQGNGASRA